MADKKKSNNNVTPNRELKVQKPGGQVQAEKHTIIYDKVRKAEFKFREPRSSDWK